MTDHNTTETPQRPTWSPKRVVLGAALSVLLHAVWVAAALLAPDNTRLIVEFELREGAQLTGLGQGVEDKPPPELPHETEEAPEDPPEEAPASVDLPRHSPKPPKPQAPKPKAPKEEPKAQAPKKKPKPQGPRPKAPKEEPKAPKEPRVAFKGEVPFKVRALPELKSIAPGNAVMTVAVKANELRRSPHRENYARMIRAIPDHHRVTGMSGVEPIDAYEEVLITSSDFMALTETMLLARTEVPREAFQAHLEAVVGEPLSWSEKDGIPTAGPKEVWWASRGDPRLFMLPAPGIVAFAKPEMSAYLARRAKAVEAREQRFFPEFPTSLEAEEAGLPAVFLLEMSGFSVKLGGATARLPTPRALQMAIHDDDRPLVRVRLVFGDESDAARFVEQWPGVRGELVGMFVMRVLGYRELLARISAAQDVSAVYLEARLEPDELVRLSKLVARLVENNYRQFLPQPGDWPTTEADAGAADAGAQGAAGEEADAGLQVEADRPDGVAAPAAPEEPDAGRRPSIRLWERTR